MPIIIDVYAEVIYITSPTANVTIQELYDETRAVEDSTIGLNFDEIIILGEGKTDVGGGFQNPATMQLNPRWYIEYWDGVLLGTVAGGNITGGLNNRPVRATVGSADTVLVLGAERGIISTDAGGIINEIAGAVWDEETSEHVDPNTYGAEVATKSDIKAVSSTDHSQAINGTIIYGTQQSGTYLSTQVKDNVYWQIGETVADGLTIEMTFNLPSADHNAGVISTFGRYVGQPANSHWMELWAWNYESLAWELLEEVFMPGGNTSDSQYDHDYFERHIDRGNNNEVLVRLIHHPTSYNSSHSLYLDYMEASSIEVLTADVIADAVWDEDLTDHHLFKSAGAAQQHQSYAGMIVIDSVNGISGSVWPIGTHEYPSDNLADALIIAAAHKIDNLRLHSDITIGVGDDVTGMRIDTHGKMDTTVTLVDGCITDQASFFNVNLNGTVSNGDQSLVQACSISQLYNFTGVMNNVTFLTNAELTVNLWATIIQGTAGGDAGSEPEISINGAMLNMSHWAGNLKLMNKTGTDRTVINCTSGNIIIDSTCVAGKVQLLGVGQLEADNSGAGCQVDIDGFITNDQIARVVWNQAEAKRLLGLMHENIFIDQPNYDSYGNLDSARVRLYSDAGSVGSTSNVIATYTITAPSVAPGQFTTWKQISS